MCVPAYSLAQFCNVQMSTLSSINADLRYLSTVQCGVDTKSGLEAVSGGVLAFHY